MDFQETSDTSRAVKRRPAETVGSRAGEEHVPAPPAPSLVAEARHPTIDPVIARFRAALKRIQSAEIERLHERLPALDERSRQAIGQFADALVAEMLHPPLQSLRDEANSGSPPRLLDALARLFRLAD
jgi:glutamyl-tRNA reductase